MIFMFTPCVAERARRALTRTSCPPRYTPARRSEWEDLSGSTLSERSHGCIPMKLVICFTASSEEKMKKCGGKSEISPLRTHPSTGHSQLSQLPSYLTASEMRTPHNRPYMYTWYILHATESKCLLNLILITNLFPRCSKVWTNNSLNVISYHHFYILQLEREERGGGGGCWGEVRERR